MVIFWTDLFRDLLHEEIHHILRIFQLAAAYEPCRTADHCRNRKKQHSFVGAAVPFAESPYLVGDRRGERLSAHAVQRIGQFEPYIGGTQPGDPFTGVVKGGDYLTAQPVPFFIYILDGSLDKFFFILKMLIRSCAACSTGSSYPAERKVLCSVGCDLIYPG